MIKVYVYDNLVDTTNGTGKLTYMDTAKDTLNSNEKCVHELKRMTKCML